MKSLVLGMVAAVGFAGTLHAEATKRPPAGAVPESKVPLEDPQIPAAKPAKTEAPVTHRVEFTTVMVDGKKTWTPAEGKVKAGTKVALVLSNTLEDPHGFEIPGLVKPQVIPGHGSVTLDVALLKPGTYPVKCHMHPAHVGAKLTVVP